MAVEVLILFYLGEVVTEEIMEEELELEEAIYEMVFLDIMVEVVEVVLHKRHLDLQLVQVVQEEEAGLL
jgi:hypothetical protein